MSLEFGQVVTQIISFLVMLWFLKRYAFGPILSVLDERRNKIQSEFDTIEKQKKEIKRLIHDYQGKLKQIDIEARNKIQESVEQARRAGQEIQANAKAQAKTIVATAQVEIQREIAKAKAQLRDELIKMTFEATQKVLKAEVNEDRQKLIMEQFALEKEPL